MKNFLYKMITYQVPGKDGSKDNVFIVVILIIFIVLFFYFLTKYILH